MPASRPRVLVTRSPRQASALAERLRQLGAEPVLVPTIETVEPTSFEAVDAALAQLDTFNWLLFTSANAVEAFVSRSTGKAPAGSIAAIGPATARALASAGFPAGLLPPHAVAESLAEALLPHARQPDGSPTRFLLVRAEEAREHLPETLRAAGAEVVIAPVYRTVIPEGATDQLRAALTGRERVEAVTFTSSSTVRNFFALLAESTCTLPESVVRASIGPITSATLRELGQPAHVEAAKATVEALAETLVEYLARP